MNNIYATAHFCGSVLSASHPRNISNLNPLQCHLPMTFLVFQMGNCGRFLQNSAFVPCPSYPSHIYCFMFNFMDFTCEKQRHYTNTPDQSQQASVLCSIKASRIWAAKGDIYVSDHKTLILPESYEVNESQFFHMDGFVIRAQSICPRCIRARRLIVRPSFRRSYFRRQVPPRPYDTRDPSSERLNCGRECWPVILPKCRFARYI